MHFRKGNIRTSRELALQLRQRGTEATSWTLLW